jgi:hypothetical protein
VIGVPWSEGAIQSNTTSSSIIVDVGAIGMAGFVAHKIATNSLSSLYPWLLRDSTLNLYVFPAVKLVAV